MKICSIESIPVHAPRRDMLGSGFKSALGTKTHSDYTIVFVETDAKITGVGEASSVFSSGALHLHELIVKVLSPILVGENPFEIARLVARMDAAMEGNGPAKAALEMALWDIKGKALNTPVYNLLGGAVRERIGLSFSIPFGPPDVAAAFARDLVRQGFRTLKVKVGRDLESDVETIRRIREAVGFDIRIRADANMAFADLEAALGFIRQIEPFRLEVFEQPLPPKELKAMALLRRKSSLPIMADESVWSPGDTLEVIRHGAADFINIYVSESGGLLNAWRSFMLCEAAGLPCIVGSMPELGIGTAANIHFATAMINLPLDCDACGVLYHAEDMLLQPLRIEGGFAYPNTLPGLGVEIDRKVVESWRVRKAAE